MKAPDKIYVEACEDGIFAFPEPPFAESVEYIRADIVKQPAEGLEEEMEKFFETMPVLEHENIFEDTFKNIARHFAEWQKAKMMEKAVEGRYMKADGKVYVESWPLDIEPNSVKAGDEVRLIVIPKED